MLYYLMIFRTKRKITFQRIDSFAEILIFTEIVISRRIFGVRSYPLNMWCTRIISWMSNTQKARHTRIWVTNRPWQLLKMINLFIIDTIVCGHIGYICIYLAILCSRYDPCAPHIQRGAANSKKSSRYDNFSENRDFGWKIYSLMVSTSLR